MRKKLLLALGLSFLQCWCAFAQSHDLVEDRQLLKFVDDKKIEAEIKRWGERYQKQKKGLLGEDINQRLAESPAAVSRRLLPSRVKSFSSSDVIHGCYSASVVIGVQYDCGKCDNIHLSTAGGVLISDDGLIVTNHHVVETEKPVAMVVRTISGDVYPVVEILASHKINDTALIRIEGDNLPFAKLADEAPLPLSSTLLISHPRNHYYTSSRGTISRYSARTNSEGESEKWMEISNEFCRGSSGSGVFNERGDLVGLVSEKSSMVSQKVAAKSNHHMTVFRCVPLESIQALFD